MSNDQKPSSVPWYHRGLWATLLGGAILLGIPYLFGQFGPVVFSESVDPRWYAVGAVVGLAVLSVAVPPLRRWWGSVFRRLGSIRVTTTGRVRATVDRAVSERPTHDDLRWSWENGRKHGESRRDETVQGLERELQELRGVADDRKRRIEQLEVRAAQARKTDRKADTDRRDFAEAYGALERELAQVRRQLLVVERDRNEQRTRAEASDRVAKRARDQGMSEGIKYGERRALDKHARESRIPKPQPRWDIQPLGGARWRLRNLAPRSVARQVRLEADDDLRILDAAMWEDLSGEQAAAGEFLGALTQRGRDWGVSFVITWWDDLGARHEERLQIAGEQLVARGIN